MKTTPVASQNFHDFFSSHSQSFLTSPRVVLRNWTGHIPFVGALIEALSPGLLVELGTHHGDSYLPMCQAVGTLKLPTRCVAIDRWAGDPQAGLYGPEVLASLKAYHDPRYGEFSTLLQKNFDDALVDFPDASIDLLHIDGLHTFEAVEHDFESWLPKLSAKAVVLFHDTAEINDREGFGVWRYWQLITQRYPGFNFSHSHGLGVLLVGPQVPPCLLAIAQAPPELQHAILAPFESLGKTYLLLEELALQSDASLQTRQLKETLYQTLELLKLRLIDMTQNLRQTQSLAGQRDQQLQDQAQALEQTRRDSAQRLESLTLLETQIQQARQGFDSLEETNCQLQSQLQNQTQALEQTRRESTRRLESVTRLEVQIQETRQRLSALQATLEKTTCQLQDQTQALEQTRCESTQRFERVKLLEAQSLEARQEFESLAAAHQSQQQQWHAQRELLEGRLQRFGASKIYRLLARLKVLPKL